MERPGSPFQDSSTRLLDPEPASGSLNPDMVHPPSAPPAQQYRDDDEDEPVTQRSLNFIVILRFLAVVFTFAHFIFQLKAFNYAPGEVEFLKGWTMVILVWNLCTLIPLLFAKAHFGKHKSRFPEISFIVGNWKIYLCGSADDEADLFEAVSPPKKSIHPITIALVDTILATVLLIVAIIGVKVMRNDRRWYGRQNDKIATSVLHFFVV
jgi:hypothetical protein